MCSMFKGCSTLTSIDESKFNTKNVTNINTMFDDCSSLTTIDVTKFNTEKVTDIYIAYFLVFFFKIITNFNTKNVINMNSMFDILLL